MTFFDNEDLLLIDLNNTLSRALAVNKHLSYKGNITGGLYGFIMMLSSTINFTLPKNIIVCDDKKPYFREDVYSKYKKDRIKNEEDEGFYEALSHNKEKVEDLLALMNIPIIKASGLEADDFIAHFTQRFSSQFDKIICLSNDSDLLSLMNYDNFYIYKRKGAKTYLYGRKLFDSDYYPVTPETWLTYTALVGSHNGFPGIKGIGPVTAKKILSDPSQLADILAKYKQHFKEAEKVLTLPYPDMVYNAPDSEVLVKHKVQQTAIDRLLATSGIMVTNNMTDAFNLYR